MIKHLKSKLPIILPSLLSLSTSGIIFNFEKRESVLGNPVYLARITYCFIFRVKEFTLAKKTVHAGSWDTLFLKKNT